MEWAAVSFLFVWGFFCLFFLILFFISSGSCLSAVSVLPTAASAESVLFIFDRETELKATQNMALKNKNK